MIVDSGYPISTYFIYSSLNIFGLAPKFIPLSFLISLIVFIIKHDQEGEFIILWTSGVKKINFVNLFFSISIFITIIYLIFSSFLTPLALNKSRSLLSNDKYNSFLPTVKKQSFSDSFKGFTFFVEKKIDNEVKNIFLYDKGGNLRNLSTSTKQASDITVIAENGMIDKKILFN